MTLLMEDETLSIEDILKESKQRLSETRKTCTKCLKVKFLNEFKTQSSASYGKSSWCKSCYSEYEKNRRNNLKGL